MSLNFNGNNIGGTPSGGGTPYILPIASENTLGGVKIDGETITITNEGVISSQGGGSVTVDSELSSSSTNPVQNKVINSALNDKQNVIDASNKLSANYVSGLASVATSGDYADLINGYSLPTASTSTLGGVKVDGSTITINDGVISSQGGGGTSNHSQLTNLDYANSGHTGFMSNANYIPAGTEITVGADKDFQTLQDAYNSLSGKWSNGTVIIKLDNGTYTSTGMVFNKNFNIKLLIIRGTDRASTILEYNATTASQVLYFSNQNIRLEKITVDGSSVNNNAGLNIDSNSNIFLNDVSIKNCPRTCILVAGSSKVIFTGSGVILDTAGTAVLNTFSSVVTCTWNCPITIKNCTTGFSTNFGATTALNGPQINFTYVTTQYSPALNNMTTGTGWNMSGY